MPMPLNGVGEGTIFARTATSCPVVLRTALGTVVESLWESAVVPDSDLPMILGLDVLRRRRCLIDVGNNVMHMVGPGDLNITLPPGSVSINMTTTPSGHLVLECSDWAATENLQRQEVAAVLVTSAPDGVVETEPSA